MREAMKEFPGDKLKIVEKFVKKRKNWENFQVVKAEVRVFSFGCAGGWGAGGAAGERGGPLR